MSVVNRYIFDMKWQGFGGGGLELLKELNLMKRLKSYMGSRDYCWFEFSGTEAEYAALHNRLNTEQSMFKVIGVHTNPED